MHSQCQRQQKQADGGRSDHDGTAHVRHQTAQRNHLGPQGAKAFDENNQVQQVARHAAIWAVQRGCGLRWRATSAAAPEPEHPVANGQHGNQQPQPPRQGMVCDTHASKPVRALNIIISQK
jgi:hypothetical protein